ncbi:MAG TPA: hypothetical protein VD907_03465 [Verrucomicrobiae bacterium]|nr:hypothetical protein [Verrucomicrobiae bacterium]
METAKKTHYSTNDGFRIISITEAIERAQYNEAGIAMTPLGSYEIAGQEIDILLVSMQPLKAVSAHLHLEGGESQIALTPVRAIFGRPYKNDDGDYTFTPDGRVEFEVIVNRIVSPQEIVSIPKGFVHGYGNPSDRHNAHIIFNLPHTHTTAEDKLLANSDVGDLSSALTEEEYQRYSLQAGFPAMLPIQ